MLRTIRARVTPGTLTAALALALAAGWAAREAAFAKERADMQKSATVPLDGVKMSPVVIEGKKIGEIGTYVAGDTPASRNFITGRFVLLAGQTPHPPHKHLEEEVMVIESGRGEIVVDGKTTQVGPGSVMFTTPNSEHGIVNTGAEPIVFYYVKWAPHDKP